MTSGRFTKSIEAMATGATFHGLTPAGSAAAARASAAASTIAASMRNRSRSSSRHWSRRPAGVSTSTRASGSRASSSATMRPAWIVLPSPTSSARRKRHARPRVIASAGSS
mgnify:CR=1 FL=1